MDRRLRVGLIAAGALPALVFALPFAVPAGIYKQRIEQSVARATGRQFTIGGPLRITLFPMFGIRADKVALANVRGGRSPDLASAEDIRVGLRFLPLLAGRVEVSRIVVDRPEIDLEVDSQGRANWLLTRPRTTVERDREARPSVDPRFKGLTLEHGRIIYYDAAGGSERAFENLEATVATTDLAKPIEISGSFALSARRVAFDGEVSLRRSLFQDRIAALRVSLTSDLLQASLAVALGNGGAMLGRMKVGTPSVRRLGAWVGARMPSGGGLGALSLDSVIHVEHGAVRLSGLKASLDGMAIAGDLALASGGEVPAVTGALSVDRLDVDPYIEVPPKHRGAQRGEGWSRNPITLDVLRKIDADLVLSAGGLAVRKLALGKTAIRVSLRDGRLSARFDPVTLYGGSGHAQLDVDARATPPVFHNRLEFENVTLQPFLSDTIGVRRIEGTGTIRLDVSSRGADADAVMHALSGRGSIAFRDGRLRGVDLGAAARAIETALGDQGAFTAYSSLNASFVATDGVLASRDFELTGPLLRMTGSGTVDLANRTIDLRVLPVASATLGKNKLTLGLPVRINGPWNRPRYSADVNAIVNGAIENLESGRAPFKGMFARPPKPKGPKKKHKSVGDALKNILGIH